MTLYACGGEGRGGEDEGREKVRRGERGRESTEASGRRESKKEKRKKKGEWRTVRLFRTEMTLALCRIGRTLLPGAWRDLGKSCPELLPHGTPGVSERWPPLPHKFLVATRGNAPGLRRPF